MPLQKLFVVALGGIRGARSLQPTARRLESMPSEKPKGAGAAAVRYDGDQKLLAFAGAITFVLAALFWALLALRLGTESSPLVLAGLGTALEDGARPRAHALRSARDAPFRARAWRRGRGLAVPPAAVQARRPRVPPRGFA